MSSHPILLIISLNKEDWQDEMYKKQFDLLKSQSDLTLKEVLTATEASESLKSLKPGTVLITTSSFAKHPPLCTQTVEYAKAGGTVIIACLFSSMIRPPDFDKFFKRYWGLEWKFANYHRNTYILNGRRNARLKQNENEENSKRKMPDEYCLKAVIVSGAKRDDMVYRPAPETYDPNESPLLFTSIGKGYLGYIGDVNAEEEQGKVILAMCNLSKSPDVEYPPAARPENGEVKTCKVCGKEGNVRKCGQCLKAAYCSRDCQADDWKKHKKECVQAT